MPMSLRTPEAGRPGRTQLHLLPLEAQHPNENVFANTNEQMLLLPLEAPDSFVARWSTNELE